MSRFISLAVLLSASFAAPVCSAPQNAQPPAQPATAPSAMPHASPIEPGDHNCIRDTGSLIPPKKGECLPVPGRSYTQQDLEGTGERNLGPALEKLDPSVTIRGNGY